METSALFIQFLTRKKVLNEFVAAVNTYKTNRRERRSFRMVMRMLDKGKISYDEIMFDCFDWDTTVTSKLGWLLMQEDWKRYFLASKSFKRTKYPFIRTKR